MRRAVTFAVSGNKYTLVFDPGIPIDEQKKWIKQAMREGHDCDSLLHWTTDGDKREFHPPRRAPKLKPATKRIALKV